MKKILICAAAVGAALMFAAPASAKGGHGRDHGYHYGNGKVVKVMPMRSNKYGMRRGHARASYVHGMNRTRYNRY